MMHTHWNDGCVLIGTADQYYNYDNQSFETKEADRDDEKIKKVDWLVQTKAKAINIANLSHKRPI